MEAVLLQIAAFLRPIFFVDVYTEYLFEVAAIVVFGLLLAAFLVRAAVQKDITMSSVDVWVALFSVWCVAAYITYPDKANLREVAKLIMPLWTYVIAKNIVHTPHDYLKVLRFLILGFVIPVVLSVVFIQTERGVEVIDYWTSIPRYRGAYAGSHSMGHNMTFLLMILMMYMFMARRLTSGVHVGTVWEGIGFRFGAVLLGVAALYCLYQSQVRTAVVGLVVFVGVLLFKVNRRVLLALVVGSTIVGAMSLPVLVPRFLNDIAMIDSGTWDAQEIGSGRPRIWRNNVDLFVDMPLDRQLAGVGIGNKLGIGGTEGITDSHNDLLDVLIQTGIVGFLLFIGLQVALFRRVMEMPPYERALFLALFAATLVMNFVSNSYVTRFGLAQMFYIALAYIEVRPRHEAAGSPAVVTMAVHGNR